MSVDILDRMERAVTKVRERLLRASSALNQAGVPCMATIDEGAVRNTRGVELRVRRIDLPAITDALDEAGFVGGKFLDEGMFRDGPNGQASEAVRLFFANEKMCPDQILAAPEILTVTDPGGLPVIKIEQTSNRAEDGMQLRDVIGVGLIDATWLPKLPPELGVRLKQILDTPDG